MLPHLKTYTLEEKELARKLFDEGAKQRATAIKNQPKRSQQEIKELLAKNNK